LLLAFVCAFETFMGNYRFYRRYFSHDIGIAKERYQFRLVIISLFVIGVFRLGIIDLLRYGHSIQSLTLIFIMLLMYGYIVKKWLQVKNGT